MRNELKNRVILICKTERKLMTELDNLGISIPDIPRSLLTSEILMRSSANII